MDNEKRRRTTHWPEDWRQSAPPVELEETVRFYRDLVGMLDQTFAESYGSNGAIFGLPSSSLTLEIVETDHHEQLCRYCSDKRGQQAALTGLQEVATQPVEQRPL